MIVLRRSLTVSSYLSEQQKKGRTIGFVPTMGALHEGHLRLLEKSIHHTDLTVCSIFVNPAQFNDPVDYQKYPSALSGDIQKLEAPGTSVLFIPAVEDIYPYGWSNLEQYDLGVLEDLYEGAYRKGHFQGVCQVLNRLFTAVKPDHIYMGQKDYQQCKVVEKLLDIIQSPARLIPVPTERAADGLALSSRNFRLTASQRKAAPEIYAALSMVKNELIPGREKELLQKAAEHLTFHGFRVDYIQLADADSLKPVESWDGKSTLVILAAAWLNDIRLIDNMLTAG